MKLKFKWMPYALILSVMVLASCEKSDDSSSTPDGNNNSSGYTPPTTNYYKIDNVPNDASYDAFAVAFSGGGVSIQKVFSPLSISVAVLNLDFPSASSSTPRAIVNMISEGGYSAFNVDTIGKDSNQVQVSLTYEYNGSYYYLKGSTGKIYVNKKNGKLRYSSDGALTLSGPKYTGSGFAGTYTRELNFSSIEGAQF
ncbi:MAG TPA: hypothetical protein PLG57_08200 [Bacteroidia bacterium]|jgi:hypothetical protein|nr:hypothetical protein [Bacteroidia bacterium]HQF29123.1 hypothetical protein [Bacteroidia bacterium]HQK98460.1 hypothetical protein [Bacteroidia bacterium]